MVYWLSRFVLTKSPLDNVKAYLFPLAILLACGESFVVRAMCLSNLYCPLDALHSFEMEGSSYYTMVTHLNLALLQVWVWKCARSIIVVRKGYPPSPKNN